MDAIVYDTNDGDDAELLTGLGQAEQFNEDANGLKDTQSNARAPDGSGGFVALDATPGAANVPVAPPVITINEVDADTTGTDEAEFIELYDGGVGGSSLDGLVVVLFNGSDNQSYQSFDLDGQVTDENGFFVLGNPGVANVDLVIGASNIIQNGPDAVALYTGDAADFPNDTALTQTNLLDAIVYDTNDGDDAELLTGLGQAEQFNEDANGLKDTQSNARVPDGSGSFVAQAPTPGESNVIIEPPELLLISDIQGSTDFDGFTNLATVGVDDRSALEGQTIRIQAIVTADFQTASPGIAGTGLGGFYAQEEDTDADADSSTSEGIFIFDDFVQGNPDVQVGDLVEVTGTVTEFFGETQISASFINVLASNQSLPTATTVTLDQGVMIDQDGDFVANLEAFEGMLVTLPETLSITEMFQLGRFGTIKASTDGRLEQFTQTNAPDAAGFAQHLQDIAARTITLDDGADVQNPDVIRIPDGNDGVLTASDSFRMGDTLTNVTGVLTYSEDFQSGSEEPEFRIHLPEADYEAANPRPETPDDVGGNFKVASLNVLNYFTTLDDGSNNAGPNNDQGARGADDLTRFGVEPASAEFDRQVTKIVQAIVQIDADVLGLVELENDDDIAITDLVGRVNTALGSEVYDFVATGDFGGDAITVGYIYKIASVDPLGDSAGLFEFDGRDFLDPLGAGRDLNRPALAQTFEHLESGQTVTVAVNHLKSKGSLSGIAADNDQLDGQGNNNATRTEAATILADWLASDPTGQGSENTLIIGDLNAYAMEDPITALKDAGFTDLAAESIPDASSFVFDGQAGTLDYALANDTLLGKVTGVTEWRINSDEATVTDYNLDFSRDPALFNPNTPARNSDHDPIIVGFNLEPVNTPPVAVADAFTIVEDTETTFAADVGVLANDSDDQGAQLTASLVDGPTNASFFELLADGSFTYAPDLNFNGSDSFTYVVSDGELSAVQSVSLTVEAVNDAPEILSDAVQQIVENTQVLAFEAQDVEDDAASLGLAISGGADAASFEFLADGTLQFKEAPDFELPGSADGDNLFEVTVEVTDSAGGSAVQELSIEVLNDRADDVIEGSLVLGSDGVDFLRDTSEDDLIRPGAGRVDMTNLGRGGADTIQFLDETNNGVREFDYVIGFGSDDFLDLGDTGIDKELNFFGRTYLFLEGDSDVIVLFGVQDFDEDLQLV